MKLKLDDLKPSTIDKVAVEVLFDHYFDGFVVTDEESDLTKERISKMLTDLGLWADVEEMLTDYIIEYFCD